MCNCSYIPAYVCIVHVCCGVSPREKPIKLESIPEAYLSQAQTARHELIERVAEVDEQLEEVFLMEEDPTVDLLQVSGAQHLLRLVVHSV